ncbi:hypothetical protein N7454_003191 [Penicillium verhagenii]|nr:hypothetical protein N7454_003191 [Penicillium verhagenii]
MRGILRSLFCLPRVLYGVEDDRLHNHLKCDEKRPTCVNCLNHNVECSFTSGARSISPSESSKSTPEARPLVQRFRPYHYATGEMKQTFRLPKSKGSPRDSKQSKASQCDPSREGCIKNISLPDLQLFHHYTISTYRTMRVDDEDVYDLWQKHIPDWGIEFPSILHLIMALSALHLGYQKPELREQYIEQADSHFTFGIRSVTSVLAQLNADNCQRVYMSAVLICFIYFGRGPRPGEYLIFSDHGPSEWLVLMNGVKSILESHHTKIFSGILGSKGDKPPEYTLTPALRSELHENAIHLQAVQRFIEEGEMDLHERDICVSAIKNLSEMLNELYDKLSAGMPGVFLMDLVIGWLYRRPEEFVHFIEQKRPKALVVLAYWAALLKFMETTWFMEGWSEHVLMGISSSLPFDYQLWLEWPLQKSQQAQSGTS